MTKFQGPELYNYFVSKHGRLIKVYQFNKILSAFNEAFMKECIHEGGRQNIGGTLGFIQIFRRANKAKGEYRMRVDFPSSAKIKKEIIAKGGIPFKNEKDEFGNIIGNNGGEKWLVYYTSEEPSLTMRWLKHKFAPKYYKFIQFTPTKFPLKIWIPEFVKNNEDKAKLIYPLDEKNYN